MLASAATCQPERVDRLKPGLNHLHRLIAGQRAQRPDKGALMQQLPQAGGTQLGQGVIDADRAAQLLHITRSEVTANASKRREESCLVMVGLV